MKQEYTIKDSVLLDTSHSQQTIRSFMEVYGLEIDVMQALSSAVGTIFAALVTLSFVFAIKKLSKLGDIRANFKDRNKLEKIEESKTNGKMSVEFRHQKRKDDSVKLIEFYEQVDCSGQVKLYT